MATFYKEIRDSYGNPYVLYLNVNENIPDDYISTNRTFLSGNVQVIKESGSGGAYNSSGMSATVTFRANNSQGAAVGSASGSTGFDFKGTAPKGATPLSFNNISVTHNSDGSFNLWCYVKLVVDGTSLDGEFSLEGNMNLTNIPRPPIFSLIDYSVTNNSISVSYESENNTSIDKVEVTDEEESFIGYYETNPLIITGLNPKTNYTFRFRGYNNTSGWEDETHSQSFTTYPNSVTITNVSSTTGENSSPINPNKMMYINVSSVVSSPVDCNNIEYSLYNSSGTTLVAGPIQNINSEVLFNELDPETTYMIKVRAQTKNSLIWSPYITSLQTTLSDQAKSWIKNNMGIYAKGKTFINVLGIYKKAKKIYEKKNGVWVVGKNN